MNFGVKDTKERKVSLLLSLTKSAEVICDSIDKRQSKRNKYDGATIPALDVEKITSASLQEDVDFVTITDKNDMEPFIELVKEGTILQFNNKAFIDELTHWISFNTTAGGEKGDGLYGKTAGSPSVPKWFVQFIMNVTMSRDGEANKYADLIQSSLVLIIFIAKRNDKNAWDNMRRSFERMALTVTSLNINSAYENMLHEEGTVRQKLIQQLNLTNAEQPLLLTGIGYSEKIPYSFRRPLQDVMVVN
jgi:hypothetical protein